MIKFSLAIIGCVLFTSCTNGQPSWECIYHPSADESHGFTEQFILVDRKTLAAYDDYSGGAIEYRIVEKSSEELIAIHHKSKPSPRLEVIIINIRTGGFRMHGLVARNLYDEHYVGRCSFKEGMGSK